MKVTEPVSTDVSEPSVGQPQQVIVVQERRGNGMSVAGFVTGLIGAIFGLIPLLFWIAFPLGILGAVFGAIGVRRAGEPGRGGKGLAIAGLILGVVAIVLAVAGVFIIDDAVSDLE
jgi:hypothetical protein